MRLFVALELPAAVGSALAAWTAAVERPELRPVASKSLHVTLCFLGEQADPDPIAASIGPVFAACPPIGEVGVSGLRWLPRRGPRALAVELSDPEDRLAALAGSVHRALGHRSESRGFLPHVTVARVRGRIARPPRLPAVELPAFALGPASLVRSHLGHGPARYERLAVWPIR